MPSSNGSSFDKATVVYNSSSEKTPSLKRRAVSSTMNQSSNSDNSHYHHHHPLSPSAASRAASTAAALHNTNSNNNSNNNSPRIDTLSRYSLGVGQGSNKNNGPSSSAIIQRQSSTASNTAIDIPPPPPPPSSSSTRTTPSFILLNNGGKEDPADDHHDDRLNYALLVILYTLQGIPMGLSASIPFLIQQKVQAMASAAAAASAAASAASAAASAAPGATAATAATSAASAAAASAAVSTSKLTYNANAIFALCSWPFSLKLLWAPIVDACFVRAFGRRKTWLVPAQALAGILMVVGANFVEEQLGLNDITTSSSTNGNSNSVIDAHFNVKGVTAFFFCLYFLMATQDIAVDGWALTMLSKKNRGRGPVCNSIGQNIGYFISFVGFLALNDAESSETLWRPLLGLPSNPDAGLVSLGSFIRVMGYFMLITTTLVALFKHETNPIPIPTTTSKAATSDQLIPPDSQALLSMDRIQKRKKDDDLMYDDDDDDEEEEHELDASEIGLKETYHRLWAVCKLPAVQWLFVILLTYRLPTALSDNVKFLKAVEYGLSKSTTALLSPTVILPLGILVPIIATKIWHGHPLRQFMRAYELRVSLVPLLDVLMLWALQNGYHDATSSAAQVLIFWCIVVASTACQAICSSLQFNAQMTFFAHRVDPAIGGSYMTLLNTCANLGSSYPPVLVMWLISKLTREGGGAAAGAGVDGTTSSSATGPVDPYFSLQFVFSILGFLWVFLLGPRVRHVAQLPDDAWRTHLLDDGNNSSSTTNTDFALFDEESPNSRHGRRKGFPRNVNDNSSMTTNASIEMGSANETTMSKQQQSDFWEPNKQNKRE